jgi:hypothetical protein
MDAECILQRSLRLLGLPDRHSFATQGDTDMPKGRQVTHPQVASCFLICDPHTDIKRNSFSLGHSSCLEHDFTRWRAKPPE